MALYGGTFSKNSANCCSGCNRYRCSANSISIAKYLASVSTTEILSKTKSEAEKMTFVV